MSLSIRVRALDRSCSNFLPGVREMQEDLELKGPGKLSTYHQEVVYIGKKDSRVL